MTESTHDVVAAHTERVNEVLRHLGLTDGSSPSAPDDEMPARSVTADRFDNRPTWDNGPGRFDNRPTWDNWDNRYR